MAEFCSRPRLVKIMLGITCVLAMAAIACIAVGVPLYFQERSKTISYVKDSCRVQSTSYEAINNCHVGNTRRIVYETCFVALWYVQLGQNGTHKGIIRADAERSLLLMQAKSDQYKVCSAQSLLLKNRTTIFDSIYHYDSHSTDVDPYS